MKFLLLSFFLFSLIQCSSDKKEEDSATKPDTEMSLENSETVEDSQEDSEKETKASEEKGQTAPVSMGEVTGSKTEVPKSDQALAGPPSTEVEQTNKTNERVTKADLAPGAEKTEEEKEVSSSSGLSALEDNTPEASTIALADLGDQEQKEISSFFAQDEKMCKKTSLYLSKMFGKHLVYPASILKHYQNFITYFSFYKNLSFFSKNSVYLEAKYKLAGKRLSNVDPEKASKVVEAYFQADQDQKNHLKQFRENSSDRVDFLNQLDGTGRLFKPVLVCMSLFESNWPNFRVLSDYQRESEGNEFLKDAFKNSYEIGLLNALEKVSHYLLAAYPGQQYEAFKYVEMNRFMKSLNHASPYFNFSAQSLLEELSTYSFKQLLSEIPRKKVRLLSESKKYTSITKNIGLVFGSLVEFFSFGFEEDSSE